VGKLAVCLDSFDAAFREDQANCQFALTFSEEVIMTMKFRKVFSAVQTVIIITSLVSCSSTQTPRKSLGIQRATARELQQTEEEKKAAKELEKKALALIDELAGEAMSLRRAENRVYVLTVMSDLLWERDEERARAFVREAMDQSVAHMREANEKSAQEDGQRFDSGRHSLYRDPYNRYMPLNLLARRDARLLLRFLPLMRSSQPDEDEERMMELGLAYQVAKSDPQTALQIAERHLNGKLDHSVISLWSELLRKDQKAASPLTKRVIGDLKSQDILADYEASRLVFRVLEVLSARANEIANARSSPDAANTVQPGFDEIQQAYRDALEVVAAAALKVTPELLRDFEEAGRGMAVQNLLTEVNTYLPDIEKHLPSRGPAARAKLTQFDKVLYLPPVQQGTSREEIENMVKDKSPEELIAMAAKSQNDSVKYRIYTRALGELVEQGDTARARQVLKDLLPVGGGRDNTWLRQQYLAGIEQKEREQAMREGKLEDVRKSVSRLRWSEERASAWIKLAAKAEADKDQKSQSRCLKEAGELLGGQMETESQVEAQLDLAVASLDLDPDRGFEILESAIERLNLVVNAEATIAKFNQRKLTPVGAVTEDGNMDDEKSMYVFNPYAAILDQRLLAFARRDFDRAIASFKRIQGAEGRLAICLTLLNRILGAEENVW
jgi:hypothetical protein